LVEAKGSILALAELGEQLAWLGAACRQAATDQIAYCTPIIRVDGGSTGSFTLDYAESNLETDVKKAQENGTCWHALFKNPVIVPRYPILARADQERGLEIPLGMMAGLAEATHATDFDGGIVIKGFSAMFIPTARIDRSVLWHLIYDEKGDRLSYCSVNEHTRCPITTGSEGVDFSLLSFSRNFLGWASFAVLKAGKLHIRYL